MTQNRIGGPSSSEPGKDPHTKAQEHRRIEKVEKVKAVDEAENERARKKFQRFMEDDERAPKTKLPSPFETSFHKASSEEENASLGGIFSPSSRSNNEEAAIVPSPAYSPAPQAGEDASEIPENPPLPQSKKFWTNVDEPSDQPVKPHQFQETESSIARGAKGKKTTEKTGKTVLGLSAEEKKAEKEMAKHEKKQSSPLLAKPSDSVISPLSKEDLDFKKSKSSEKKESSVLGAFPKPEEVSSRKDFLEREKEREGHGKRKETIAIEAPSQHLLPSQVIPLAESAAAGASSLLSPQTLPLFFQMVGTIYAMASQTGVSKTEVVLNAPGFANSKFFGSTISIEKYASAPDALNIRLTGSTEAVTAFNQNISNLYAAFENGNFKFRIGRITAEYSIEKPVFRRKDSERGSKEGSMGEDQGRRG